MTDYQPIDCALHDLLEVACLAKIPVRITTFADGEIEGLPVDVLAKSHSEYLVIRQEDGTSRIRIDRIQIMRALRTNPHFSVVVFGQP